MEIPSMMGRDSFLVYWAIFLMRNMCFQSKRRAAFQFIKLSLVSYFCNNETCVFKSSRRMHFSLFSNFCSTKTCLFKTIDRLLFSLFSSFCNSEACVSIYAGASVEAPFGLCITNYHINIVIKRSLINGSMAFWIKNAPNKI